MLHPSSFDTAIMTQSTSVGQKTFGTLFIGFVISSILYGLTFFQTYMYYAQFPKDRPRTMIVVGLLWALDTAATGLTSHALYFYLITEFGQPFGMLSITSMLCVENTLTTIIVFIIQMYLITRLLDVGHRARPAVSIGVLLAFVSFGLGIYVAVGAFKQRELVQLAMPAYRLGGGLYTGFSTICDLYTVFVSCWYLRPSVTASVKPSEGFIDTAFMYTFSRGMFIGVVQFLLFLTFVINPAAPTWLPFHLMLGKVYVNSLLAMLNCREIYKGRGVNEGETLRIQVHSTENIGLQLQDSFGDVGFKTKDGRARSDSNLSPFQYSNREREVYGMRNSDRPIQLTLIKHKNDSDTRAEELQPYKPYKHIPHESIEEAQTPVESARDCDAFAMLESEDQPILEGKKKNEKRNSRRY